MFDSADGKRGQTVMTVDAISARPAGIKGRRPKNGLILFGTLLGVASVATSLALFLCRKAHSPEVLPVSPSRSVVDFGRVVEGSDVFREIELKNRSSKKIIWVMVHGTCGCTRPFTAASIAPESTSVLKVRYHSAGRNGAINQNILLYAKGMTNPSLYRSRAKCFAE